MIKSKLGKIIIALIIASLGLISIWLTLFFLIKQDRLVVSEFGLKTGPQLSGGNNSLHLSKNQILEINNYFLNSSTTINLLESLERLGQTSGLKVAVAKSEETASDLALNLRTEGSYSGTIKFIEALEVLPFASRLDRLELRKESKNWQSTFVLRILKK